MVRRPLPDELDRRILAELKKDARVSFRELSRRLNVSTPTVSYRIRRMEDAGLITGYRVVAATHESGESVADTPDRMRCASCKGPIHGPATIGRFGGHAQAFCCGVCLETFSKKFRHAAPDSKERGAVLMVLLGWVVSLGALGAACLGAGPMCTTPGVVPVQPNGSCWTWDRPRQEMGAASPILALARPPSQGSPRVPESRRLRSPATFASLWSPRLGA